ncbi:Transmembrane protein 33 [Ophiophagus hannah]|uniref:Transmembrane protein 33 n=1 Tax=Ophiophagus hannah TaxID=8665 RepID=V8N6N1_OPHHA|nr:Transmembrane protein 33 [Ophiophagus hannah]
MTNKLDTAMWLSRIFTIYCSALFVLPLLGFQHRDVGDAIQCSWEDDFEQWLVCVLTSPWIIPRLHEAASFYQRALLANALTSALRLHQRLPHFQLSRAFLSQALLEDSCHYLLYSLIFARGSDSLPFLRNLLDKLNANQQNILKFIACNEIFLMPATVFMLFSGQGSLLQPFIYYRFLTLRYSSRRNPYCR